MTHDSGGPAEVIDDDEEAGRGRETVKDSLGGDALLSALSEREPSRRSVARTPGDQSGPRVMIRAKALDLVLMTKPDVPPGGLAPWNER
jgi:hypothetical protein